MYIEDNIENEIGYSTIFNQLQDKSLILEDLKSSISTQFNFNNIGYNYLNDYDNPPLEIYDWLLQYFNETYFVIDDFINIYNQVDSIKLSATFIYEFLFVDVIDLFPKISQHNKLKNELSTMLSEIINSLTTIKNENEITNSKLDYNILKYSTILILLDTDLTMFKDNYWTHIENILIV